MIRRFLKWLGSGAAVLAVAIGIAAVKYTFFETDAEKKADGARMEAKFDDFMSKHDKTGIIAQGTAMVSLMTSFRDGCQATITSSNGSAISDDDKKSFCECAALGMLKLYYAKLPHDELIERSNTGDQGPAPIQKEVFAACNTSRRAYAAPPSPQP
jgi:hypothetical protein